jgi:flagellar FliJ protein
MNPLQPLLAVLEQAEQQRDEARSALQRATDAHQHAQAQAAQLLDYRRDYERRWSAQFQAGGRIEIVHCYRGFMDRLTQAVEQQQRIAGHAATQVERARASLAGHELRVGALRKLIERRHQEMRVAAGRHEQRQTDESAARMSRDTPSAPGFGTGLSEAA